MRLIVRFCGAAGALLALVWTAPQPAIRAQTSHPHPALRVALDPEKQRAEHRRAALQKYRDHVRAGGDFALADFRSRDSAATEAVGYGKTLDVPHAAAPYR